VSFTNKDLDKLEKNEYVWFIQFLETTYLVARVSFWVCEKSDGVRVLFLICTTGADQAVYLVCYPALLIPCHTQLPQSERSIARTRIDS
jgi:hypothetical protein